MTISSELSAAGPYNGNGATTIFPYGFKITDKSHIRVVLLNANGTTRDLSLADGDFIVSGAGNAAGGSIKLTVAPRSGEKITLLRNLPFTQETDLPNQGPYFAETVESRFDLTVMQIQAVKEITDRSFKVEPGQEVPDLSLIVASEGFAQDAQASADASAGSASASAASATLSDKFANNPEDIQVIVGSGLYSTRHYLAKVQALWNSVVTGLSAAIHAATAKTSLADTDEFGISDSAASWGLKRVTLSSLVSSIFRTARTISNARFAADTFRILDAAAPTKAWALNASAITAGQTRSLFMPDRDVNLGSVGDTFVSSDSVLALGGLVTIAHGLGAAPNFVDGWLVFQNAVGGYLAGDRIKASLVFDNVGSSSGIGIACYIDATNINIRMGNAAVISGLIRKDTGANFAPSLTDLKLRITARL
jgi:hypothetical protein